jgi:zinc transport system permease protein
MSFSQLLSYPFMQRALIAGALVSLCCALLGVSLVLKRYSMIGDGLSHVSFGALAVAVALGFTPLYFSIPVVIVAAFFLLRMANHPGWNNDAAIAVMSASALSIGILVISLTTGMTTDVDNYMFGSVLAMTKADVGFSVGLSAAVLVLFVLLYHKLFAITFDESFSRATGLRVELYNTLLSVLTALTIVLGMRMMGAMLISSLIIFPALTAMRLFKSFRSVVICAGISAVACFAVGLITSFVASTPVGATVVMVDLAVFLISCLIAADKKRLIAEKNDGFFQKNVRFSSFRRRKRLQCETRYAILYVLVNVSDVEWTLGPLFFLSFWAH